MSAIPHTTRSVRGPGLSTIVPRTSHVLTRDVSSSMPNFRPQKSINKQGQIIGKKREVLQQQASVERLGGVILQTRVGGYLDLPRQQRTRRRRVAQFGSTRFVPTQVMNPAGAEAASGMRAGINPSDPLMKNVYEIRIKNRSEIQRIQTRIRLLERRGTPTSAVKAEINNLKEQLRVLSRDFDVIPDGIPKVPLPDDMEVDQGGSIKQEPGIKQEGEEKPIKKEPGEQYPLPIIDPSIGDKGKEKEDPNEMMSDINITPPRPLGWIGQQPIDDEEDEEDEEEEMDDPPPPQEQEQEQEQLYPITPSAPPPISEMEDEWLDPGTKTIIKEAREMLFEIEKGRADEKYDKMIENLQRRAKEQEEAELKRLEDHKAAIDQSTPSIQYQQQRPPTKQEILENLKNETMEANLKSKANLAIINNNLAMLRELQSMDPSSSTPQPPTGPMELEELSEEEGDGEGEEEVEKEPDQAMDQYMRDKARLEKLQNKLKRKRDELEVQEQESAKKILRLTYQQDEYESTGLEITYEKPGLAKQLELTGPTPSSSSTIRVPPHALPPRARKPPTLKPRKPKEKLKEKPSKSSKPSKPSKPSSSSSSSSSSSATVPYTAPPPKKPRVRKRKEKGDKSSASSTAIVLHSSASPRATVGGGMIDPRPSKKKKA